MSRSGGRACHGETKAEFVSSEGLSPGRGEGKYERKGALKRKGIGTSEFFFSGMEGIGGGI